MAWSDNYEGLSEEDKRLRVEARILSTMMKYGGKRIVAGKTLHDLVQDLTNEFYRLRGDRDGR